MKSQSESGVSLAQRLPLRILVVEDSTILRRVTAKMLARFGYNACEASDGQQAVQRARDEAFHLVLMDLCLPVLDGFQSAHQMREEGSRAWIAAMTATITERTEMVCLAAGMNSVLAKPLGIPTLLKTLRRASVSARCSTLVEPIPASWGR